MLRAKRCLGWLLLLYVDHYSPGEKSYLVDSPLQLNWCAWGIPGFELDTVYGTGGSNKLPILFQDILPTGKIKFLSSTHILYLQLYQSQAAQITVKNEIAGLQDSIN